MAIEVKNVTYKYMAETPYEKIALKNINLTISEGKFIAIAGHTGSGKSTLMQHLNGLITPTIGEVFVDGININDKKNKDSLKAKRSIGMVFQYPEQQLFEESIYKDIAFGPKNFGLDEEEIEKRVKEALDFVELDYKIYKDKSPFSLSGGQMRRVAMAGIIALKPKYLVLDEPTAGLDPGMKRIILGKIDRLHKEKNTTIIMVSHNMDDIAELSEEVVIMNNGEMKAFGDPKDIFKEKEILQNAGLLIPDALDIMEKLKENHLPVKNFAIRKKEALEEIKAIIKAGDIDAN